jgi:ribose-phosphate pyrophosphokinase
MKNDGPMLFSGSSHVKLGAEIAAQLKIQLGKISLGQFPDGEIAVEIKDDVQGRDVFVLQSIAINPSHYLMELLIIVDALKRSSAKNIVAIIPYFGYCRQDRIDKPGVPITAKLIANLLSTAGITRLMTLDLHAGQLEGYFEIPVDHLHCQELFVNEAKKMLGPNSMAVAPDIGSIKIVKKVAKLMNSDFAVIEKQRLSEDHIEMILIGNLTSKNILIADDICSTGATLIAAAQLCKDHGAEKIIGAVTHGICSNNAVQKLESSPFDAIIITNSIPSFDRFAHAQKIHVISVASLIASAIQRLRL